jgi:hypothetical protein
MWHHRQRQRRHTKALGFMATELAKFVGADHHRWQAACFYLDSVMDTPRRTRASITRANKHRVATPDEVGK